MVRKYKAEKTAAEETSVDSDDDLVATDVADLEMRGVEWLWPDRFALGKIGLIGGMPDMGKGQIAAFFVAAVTNYIELPCGEGRTPQGSVLWFNAEDGASDTVKPRLIAAGANLDRENENRVHVVNNARKGGTSKTFNLATDLPRLRKLIKQIGNAKLVIIDPISAYLGVGKVDGRSATDVRGVLTPLKEMAEELHVAIVGICHFNKKDDVKSAILRICDSIAWVAASRHVFAVLDDPEDKDSKLFVKAKNNLGRDTKALRYSGGVKQLGRDKKGVKIEAPFVVWVTACRHHRQRGHGGQQRQRLRQAGGQGVPTGTPQRGPHETGRPHRGGRAGWDHQGNAQKGQEGPGDHIEQRGRNGQGMDLGTAKGEQPYPRQRKLLPFEKNLYVRVINPL
jgi:hypothetical protein